MRISDWSSDVCSSDLDKLALTLETDGTVTPEDAIAYAARILQDQLQLFVHFEEALAAATPSVGVAAAATTEGESDANQINRRSAEHTSELQSLMRISYDVSCLTKKTNHIYNTQP